ncbi:MAG: phage tail sheath subtilisin-like domain-containing protein [Pseudomonadota bacterium]
MAELLAPGVHFIETSFRPGSIQPSGTSTSGFVGPVRSGPRTGTPRLVTSFGEFERLYGGLAQLDMQNLGDADPFNYLALAVRGCFNEGGTRVYISPVFLAQSTSDGVARAALVGASEADPRHFVLRARFPGSAGNGTITVSEIVTPATPAALNGAQRGSLARTRGEPAEPATITATAAAGALSDGATLNVTVDSGAPQALTFTAGPATATAATALTDPVDIPAGTTLVAVVDGVRNVVPVTAGNAIPLDDVRAELDGAIANASVALVGDALSITSNALGTAISVAVAQNDTLGFTDPTTEASGTGMRRLDNLRPEDLNTVFAAAGVGLTASLVPGTDRMTIATNATGNAASIDVSDPANAATLTALGFDAAALGATVTGQDGVARRIFVKTGSAIGSWQEFNRQPSGRWTATGGLVDAASPLDEDDHLVTLGLTFTTADSVSTTYEGLGFDENHRRWFGHRMVAVANPDEAPLNDPLVRAENDLNTPEVHAALFASGRADENDVLSNTILLSGGNDGTLPALQNWTDAIDRLSLVDDISIVAAPGSTAYGALGDDVRASLIAHCENDGFRIAVCDPPRGQDLNAVRRTRGTIDSTFAAFYAPWLVIANPTARPGDDATPTQLRVPPSGHICGIYGRNDVTVGVHKTPANEVIREARSFEVMYNQAHQEVLNPIGVNVSRTLDGRGNRVYGGRLTSSDPEMKYVSDRRYLNYLKKSIKDSTQSYVFMPNGPELWADIREAVASFLFAEWTNGRLVGSTPETSYFVNCGRNTMTQFDLDNGRLKVEAGVAWVKPAEFVVFIIGQTLSEAR